MFGAKLRKNGYTILGLAINNNADQGMSSVAYAMSEITGSSSPPTSHNTFGVIVNDDTIIFRSSGSGTASYVIYLNGTIYAIKK